MGEFEELVRGAGGTFVEDEHVDVVKEVCKRLGDKRHAGGVCKAISVFYLASFDHQDADGSVQGFRGLLRDPRAIDVIFQMQQTELAALDFLKSKQKYDVWSYVPFSGQFWSPVPDPKLEKEAMAILETTHGREGLERAVSSLLEGKAVFVDEGRAAAAPYDDINEYIESAALGGRFLLELPTHGMSVVALPKGPFVFFDCNFGQGVFRHSKEGLLKFTKDWLSFSEAYYHHKTVTPFHFRYDAGAYKLPAKATAVALGKKMEGIGPSTSTSNDDPT